MWRFLSSFRSVGSEKDDASPGPQTTQDLAPVIPRLLKCNDSPNDDERFAIFSRITEVRKEFETWRPYAWTPFPTLRGSKFSTVPENLKPKALLLDQHYHLISGIRILPNELLEHILFQALPVTIFRQPQQHAKRHFDMYRLMGVCKKWHYVVVSSPRFWTHLPPVRMTDQIPSAAKARRERQLFNVYRGRSGELPVTVELSVTGWRTWPGEWEGKMEWRDGCLAALISLASRWQSVVLEVTRTTLVNVLPCITRQDLRMLRQLSLSFTDDDYSSELWTPLDLESKCPLLHHVSLVYVDTIRRATSMPEIPKPVVKVPHSRLTEFDESVKTSEGRWDTWHIDSRSTPSSSFATGEGGLRLKQRIEASQPSFFQSATTLHSSYLVALTLIINEGRPAATSAFAGVSFFLPLLTDLTIESSIKLPLFSLVLNTVRCSQCSLRKLSLHGFENEVGRLAKILALCPELKHLKLTAIPPAEDLLRMQFNPGLPNIVLVPRLETLELDVRTQWNEPLETSMITNGRALTDMVRSRVDLVDARHRIHVARLSAMVKTPSPIIARRLYDQLERNVATPERELSTDKKETFELVTLTKWDGVLRKKMKREAPRIRTLPNRDYHIVRDGIDDVVKEMEEYQISGSDIRLLLKWNIPTLLDQSIGIHGRVYFHGDDEYEISERLLALRERWRKVIAADIASSRHWIFNGVQNMIFLPADDVQRMDLESLWKAAKGERLFG